jgi:ketosteroid isomerase-like protein
MERSAALRLLAALHTAQNAFYAGGDDAELRALLSPEVVWTVPGRNAIAGVYREPVEVLGYFARRRDIASRTFRMHRRDVLVGDGDDIAALTDGTAVVRGRERRWSTVGLYGVRNGQIARCWLLPLDPAEFDDIWSAESS